MEPEGLLLTESRPPPISLHVNDSRKKYSVLKILLDQWVVLGSEGLFYYCLLYVLPSLPQLIRIHYFHTTYEITTLGIGKPLLATSFRLIVSLAVPNYSVL